jgi:hypothetical protein
VGRGRVVSRDEAALARQVLARQIELGPPGDPDEFVTREGPRSVTVGVPGLTHAAVTAPAWWRPGMPAGLVELLAVFRYKPRWRFELQSPAGSGGYGDWVLVVHTWVEDVFRPGVWAEGHFAISVPAGVDGNAEFWEHWLRDATWRGPEEHEVGEWFRVGDRRPFDPHAKGGG